MHTRDRSRNAKRPPLWSRRWLVGSRDGQVSWLTARPPTPPGRCARRASAQRRPSPDRPEGRRPSGRARRRRRRAAYSCGHSSGIRAPRRSSPDSLLVRRAARRGRTRGGKKRAGAQGRRSAALCVRHLLLRFMFTRARSGHRSGGQVRAGTASSPSVAWSASRSASNSARQAEHRAMWSATSGRASAAPRPVSVASGSAARPVSAARRARTRRSRRATGVSGSPVRQPATHASSLRSPAEEPAGVRVVTGRVRPPAAGSAVTRSGTRLGGSWATLCLGELISGAPRHNTAGWPLFSARVRR